MAMESHPLLCGQCNRPIDYKVPGDETSEIGCEPCSNWASRDDAVAIAKEYAVDAAQIALNRAAKRVAQSTKMMTFKGSLDLTRSYRFIVGGIL